MCETARIDRSYVIHNYHQFMVKTAKVRVHFVGCAWRFICDYSRINQLVDQIENRFNRCSAKLTQVLIFFLS